MKTGNCEKINNSKWNYYFLALASGVLLFLSFPKYGSGYLAWIALIPLFLALNSATSLRQAFLAGFICGIVFNIGLIYWIVYVVVNYGHLPYFLGVVIMLLLAAYLSLYIAFFALGIVYLRGKMPLYLLAPLLWISLEYLKSQLLTGFPWENLGYSQYLNFYFIQFADIAGVYGMSFIIVLVNAVVCNLVIKKSKREVAAAVAVAFIMLIVYCYGYLRVNHVYRISEKFSGTDVYLVQGNIDQSVKWDGNYQKETVNIYKKLSLGNMPAPHSLIVWPETAIPFYFQDESPMQQQINEIATTTKSWFLFGSPSYVTKKREKAYYNSAYLISPEGAIAGKYDKVHLVPYGEYVPLRNWFPFIGKLTAGMGDFAVGEGYQSLQMARQKIGILICYEAILPEAARMYKRDGARLLLTITNDAWFGRTSAPYQHFSMAVLRAVETRMYLVRAANTGISGIVDPAGRIIAQTKIFEKTALNGKVRFVAVPTIYSVTGDILVLISCLVVIFFILGDLKRRFINVDGKHAGKNK